MNYLVNFKLGRSLWFLGITYSSQSLKFLSNVSHLCFSYDSNELGVWLFGTDNTKAKFIKMTDSVKTYNPLVFLMSEIITSYTF